MDGLEIRDGVLIKYRGSDASVAVPEGVVKIGCHAFAWRDTLQEVILPEGLQVIGARAFEGDRALKKVVLPDSIRRIERAAFRECSGLKQVTLPTGLREMELWVFRRCSRLEQLIVPGDVPEAVSGSLVWEYPGIRIVGENVPRDPVYRFVNNPRNIRKEMIRRRGDFLYRGEAPEGSVPVTAVWLLDIDKYSDIWIPDDEYDYFIYYVSASAETPEGGAAEQSFCVFGTGQGEAIIQAYIFLWQQGYTENYRILSIGEVQPEEPLRGRMCITWKPLPAFPVQRILERLDADNCRLAGDVIDVLYSMSEEEILAYDTDVLPWRARPVGSETPISEEELMQQDWRGNAYDLCFLECATFEGKLLNDLLCGEFKAAEDKEEKKRILCAFFLVDGGTRFLSAAYRMFLENRIPDTEAML